MKGIYDPSHKKRLTNLTDISGPYTGGSTRTENKDSYGVTTGVKYQGPASKTYESGDDKRAAKAAAKASQQKVRDRVERDKGKSYRGQSAIDKKVKQRDSSKDEGLGAGVRRAKGALITKPSTTTKPTTQRKTLVQKKS